MITVASSFPYVAGFPAPFRVTLAGAFQVMPVVHRHVPAGMATVSPATARFTAVCTSAVLQDAAVIVAAKASCGVTEATVIRAHVAIFVNNSWKRTIILIGEIPRPKPYPHSLNV